MFVPFKERSGSPASSAGSKNRCAVSHGGPPRSHEVPQRPRNLAISLRPHLLKCPEGNDFSHMRNIVVEKLRMGP